MHVSISCVLIASLFQVHVFKPATSKAGNSEVYVVALDYQAGLPLDRFMKFIGVWTTLSFHQGLLR